MRILLNCIFLFCCTSLFSQSYIENFEEDMAKLRIAYKEGFIDHRGSPLTAADTGFIDFYKPEYSWIIDGKVTLTPDEKEFELPTYSGKTRTYRKYALVALEHNGIHFQLSLYQNLSVKRDSTFLEYLFLPFTDLTNGETTYEGGRYLDFSIGEIQKETLKIDFNKCYNPFCAYSDGYNCPVPPADNRLKIEIPAGEKKFKKEKKH